MSPLYSYIQKLITGNRPFVLHLSSGEQFSVIGGNASLSAANALLLKIGTEIIAVEEAAITYISHNGAIAT